MTYLTSSLVKGLVAPSVPWCWQWQRECGQTPGCSLPSEASCRAALVNHTPSQSVCVCLLWISFFSRLTCRPRLCLYVDTCTCAFSVLLSIASYSSTVPNIRNKILKSTKKNVLTNGTCTYLHLTLTHSLSLCVSVYL